jgi:hypothetical protein
MLGRLQTGRKAIAKEKAMKRKKSVDPLLPGRYGRMAAAELDQEVAKFDEEFIVETAQPLTVKEHIQDRRAKHKRGRPRVGGGARRVLVTIEASLLRRSDVYAKKHGFTRSALIARGLEDLLGTPSGRASSGGK